MKILIGGIIIGFLLCLGMQKTRGPERPQVTDAKWRRVR